MVLEANGEDGGGARHLFIQHVSLITWLATARHVPFAEHCWVFETTIGRGARSCGGHGCVGTLYEALHKDHA